MITKALITILFTYMLLAGVRAQDNYAVKDAKPDVFSPVSFDTRYNNGHLRKQMQFNLAKHLLQLHLNILPVPLISFTSPLQQLA